MSEKGRVQKNSNCERVSAWSLKPAVYQITRDWNPCSFA